LLVVGGLFVGGYFYFFFFLFVFFCWGGGGGGGRIGLLCDNCFFFLWNKVALHSLHCI